MACAFSTIKLHLGLQEELDAGSGGISSLLVSICTSHSFSYLVSGIIHKKVFDSKGEIWIDSQGFI